MKSTLKTRSSRPSPEDALRIVDATAPTQPPAQVEQDDLATTLNLRVRQSTVDAITKVSREQGMTMKQVVARALAAAGVPVAPADLEDRTPRRR